MDPKTVEVKQPYETTYIITPDLDQSEYAQIVEKFNKLMRDFEAEIENQEIWGFRKLAYTIRKRESGYFVFTEFSAYGPFIERLEREYQYDDRIIRYLTVSLDKHAVAYNHKRREKVRSRQEQSQLESDPDIQQID